MKDIDILPLVKENLILEHGEDDNLVLRCVRAAVRYAELKQKKPVNFYDSNAVSDNTLQAIIMLASHYYESRDGGTGGFFNDTASGGEKIRQAVDRLLSLEKDWTL
jgi:hypothetical protein